MSTEELMLVTHPTQPPVTSWDELQEKTYIVMAMRCRYRVMMEQWQGEADVPPMKVMEFGTWEGILQCVAAGLGFTLITRSFVERWERAGMIACHPIPGKSGQMDTVFVHRKDVYMSAALRAFLEMIDTHPWS